MTDRHKVNEPMSLRLPQALRPRLEAAAKAMGVTRHRFVIQLLERELGTGQDAVLESLVAGAVREALAQGAARVAREPSRARA